MDEQAKEDVPNTPPHELPQAVARPKPSLRKGLLSDMFAQHTASGPDALKGGDLFRRKRVTFLMPREKCTAPFPEDFELTLQELSAAQELEVSRGAKTAQELPMQMAKASMHGLNNEPITFVQRDWLWEALGQGGRVLVAYVYNVHLSAMVDTGGEGKALIEKAALEARIE